MSNIAAFDYDIDLWVPRVKDPLSMKHIGSQYGRPQRAMVKHSTYTQVCDIHRVLWCAFSEDTNLPWVHVEKRFDPARFHYH